MMTWTADNEAILRQLWLDGRSCSQISVAIGCGITRNAVIGKIYRLGLRDGADQRSKPHRGPRRPRSVPPPAPPPSAQPPPPMTILPAFECVRVELADLNPFMCKWPLGDPMMPEFRYCGCITSEKQSYCARHSRLAFQPSRFRS
jgi:GcrA cell cycle regulator